MNGHRDNPAWRHIPSFALLSLVVLLALIGRTNFLHAANVSIKPEGHELALSGEILPGDALKLRAAVEDARHRGISITSIKLNSIGGNLRESVIILRMIKSAKLSTVVGRNDICASSCFLILAAGKPRMIFQKARVGVHAASDGIDWKNKKSMSGNRAAVRIAKALGVPYGIRLKMLTTPPIGMAWLDRSDLRKMAVGNSNAQKTVKVVQEEDQSFPEGIRRR